MSRTDPPTERPEVNWTEQLALQLSWHWENQLRKRLEGLCDDEYFWEPVEESWSVRPRGLAGPTTQVGPGRYTIDFACPTPDPAPVTTIAWRLGHLLVGVFGARNASHFGASPVGYDSFDYPGSAAAALLSLDENYRVWIDGVRSLSPTELSAPCGEPDFEAAPMAALVLHIHREVIHHGAEICLLRDLYARR